MTEGTGRPCHCPILQQRRIRQLCVFTIKLTATSPTPSTVRESSQPRPPGRALGKFPHGTETRSGRAVPRWQVYRPLPAHPPRLREPGGKQTPRARLSRRRSQGVPGAALRSGCSRRTSPEASPGFTLRGPKASKVIFPRRAIQTTWGAQGRRPGRPSPRPDVQLRADSPRLTCPRRILQPLDRSHQAPLEKFPNFFAALQALASGRPNESQKEETATAHAPGLCVHHRCPGHSFPRRGPQSPRAPCAAGAGKGSVVEVPKRCYLSVGWDAGFTCGHLAVSGGAPRLRHRSSQSERRQVSLSSGARWRRASEETAGVARSPRVSGSGHRRGSRGLGWKRPTWDVQPV